MSESAHYTIPKEPGRNGALLLAVVVHLALLAFLWIGVSWQSSEHGGVEAEVWDTQYREAAPKAVVQPEAVQQEKQAPAKPEPKHEPKQELKEVAAKVDIALEQEKKRREARKKAEDEKRQQVEADKKKKKEAEDKRKQDLADQKVRDKARADEMRRIAGTGGSGTAPRSTGRIGGDPGYGTKIAPKIRANTRFKVPDNLDGNPSVEYAIELLPDGSLRTRPRLLKASGLSGFDDAVLRAIEISVPFPPDRTGKVPSSFTLIRKPKG